MKRLSLILFKKNHKYKINIKSSYKGYIYLLLSTLLNDIHVKNQTVYSFNFTQIKFLYQHILHILQ